MDMGNLNFTPGVHSWISYDSQNKELSFPDTLGTDSSVYLRHNITCVKQETLNII
jgi:hypothetical protein